MGGYDTSSAVTLTILDDIRDNNYGKPEYWLRYLLPSPSATRLDANPVAECEEIWDSGGPHIGPITAPKQTNLGMNDFALGQGDADAFIGALTDVYNDVSPLLLPANGVLWCWLDCEHGTHLSAEYWDGWAETIREANFSGMGQHLFPAIYCTPGSDDVCTVINNASGNDVCFAVWSPEPNIPGTCGHDLNNPPSGKPTSCSQVGTVLWQFLITPNNYCSLNAPVDMNVSPLVFSNQCFYLNARP
jgi:hypothetical protein